MLKWLSVCLVALLLGCSTTLAQPLAPAQHGDYVHYTYALTWQPGFCGTGGGCLPSQPKQQLIGLHGLWASEPQSLIQQGIPVQQWWAKGCALYTQDHTAPALPPAMQQTLTEVMPQLKDDLLTHEYVKHAQCFGFDPTTFFDTALKMRKAVVDSDFGRYLQAQTGVMHRREDLVAAFTQAFGTDQVRSLQLQCGKDGQGRNVLTQLWFTLSVDQLGRFPQRDAFVNTPDGEYEDNCTQPFLMPGWMQ